jgi:glycosyltransferase involved in cell wall biosynthesis
LTIKITACCITHNRPALLARAIECFNRQTYPLRELLCLDDCGQYGQQSGDRWQIVSVNRHFLTIGELRNTVAAMVSRDTDALAVMDDDDIYMPWWLESLADAFEHGDQWVQPRHALEWATPAMTGLLRYETFSRSNPGHFDYHGQWAYRRDAFARIGGYPFAQREEADFVRRMVAAVGASANTDKRFPPFYIYDRFSNKIHMSEDGSEGRSRENRQETIIPVTSLAPCWDRDYAAIPIPSGFLPRKW